MRGLLTPAVVGSLLLAILSTVADYVWFLNIPQHQVVSGAIHGATLFAALGLYLGWRKGQAAFGAAGGLLSGLVAALSFYVLAPLGGYSMMFVSWLLLWIMLAALQTYLDGRLDLAKAIGRGIITAIVAAVGFGVVLFRLYRGWPPHTFPAFTHFIAWSLAYLPGLYVLLKR
ncbi:MAG TPA: hypothetical protein VM096_14355 [Vicinamibacterales bacterium]|nr:hypothetical protein [Vicinamibacterales bacterium]